MRFHTYRIRLSAYLGCRTYGRLLLPACLSVGVCLPACASDFQPVSVCLCPTVCLPGVAPGPPAEKEPPPPSRYCSTVTAMERFRSFQPPSKPKARRMCVCGDAAACLQHGHGSSRIG
jgi:hypothetical protein